jgi:hypothetical protein
MGKVGRAGVVVAALALAVGRATASAAAAAANAARGFRRDMSYLLDAGQPGLPPADC